MDFAMQIDGSELDRAFQRAAAAVRNKIARRAVNAAAAPIVSAARSLVRRRSGLMAKALGRRVKVYDENTVAVIGPRTDVTGQVNGKLYRPSKVAHLLEYGHVLAKKGRGQVGTVPPYPFMRPAFDGSQDQALNVMAGEFETGIRKAVEGGEA